jgi:hypothetical protein
MVTLGCATMMSGIFQSRPAFELFMASRVVIDGLSNGIVRFWRCPAKLVSFTVDRHRKPAEPKSLAYNV